MKKKCTKCKVEKEVVEFHKDIKKPDGLYPSCKNCRSLYKIKWYQKNKEKVKQYEFENKDRIKEVRKLYYKNNKSKMNHQSKIYYKINKKEINKKSVKYVLNKQKTNIEFRLLCLLRSRLLHAIKGKSKSQKTLELLGCTVEELKKHLENQFKPGMNWDNHGYYGWHIDHIKPCASFDLSKPEEQQKCFHYSNLQPLWAEENREKFDKVINNKGEVLCK